MTDVNGRCLLLYKMVFDLASRIDERVKMLVEQHAVDISHPGMPVLTWPGSR